MKKFIIKMIVFIMLFSVSVCFAGDEVPTEVPPCPDEYKGGLIP